MPEMIPERPLPDAARGPHWCIVLAAGASRRLGRPKQLVQARDGVPLVVLACRRALATRPAGLVVVVGARGSQVSARLREFPATVVSNRKWRDGLASSLRVGVERVPSYAPSVLVLTVDQWAVTTADLRKLLRAGAPACAAYDGAIGVPALLPRCWRPEIRALRGDRGAGRLLSRAGVEHVSMPSAGRDLDVPLDLEALRRSRTHALVRAGI
jgi:molybdenum cofactor cytidylyltransferase